MLQNGTTEALLLIEQGFEVDKFPLARVSTEWIRTMFGAGRFRGNWFACLEGKWKPLGQVREVRLSSQAAANVQPVTRTKLRTVPYAANVTTAAPAPELEERDKRALVSERVRAEREISQMRLDAYSEITGQVLQAERNEHARVLKRLEERMRELEAQQEEEEEGAQAQVIQAAPPHPLDFLRPMLEPLLPAIQATLPGLLARWAGVALPPAIEQPPKEQVR